MLGQRAGAKEGILWPGILVPILPLNLFPPTEERKIAVRRRVAALTAAPFFPWVESDGRNVVRVGIAAKKVICDRWETELFLSEFSPRRLGCL